MLEIIRERVIFREKGRERERGKDHGSIPGRGKKNFVHRFLSRDLMTELSHGYAKSSFHELIDEKAKKGKKKRQ